MGIFQVGFGAGRSYTTYIRGIHSLSLCWRYMCAYLQTPVDYVFRMGVSLFEGTSFFFLFAVFF